MDRSFAARLGRTFTPAGGATARANAPALRRALTATRALVARGWRLRRLRVALLGVLLALPLLGGGWLLLRDSSFVAVERVQISGVHGVEAARVESALRGAARRMSTLHLDVGALRAAVAPLRVVRDLSVHASFPHGLRIDVIEQPPVAALTVGGERTAVAADGAVLGPALLSGALPAIHATGVEPLLGGEVEGAALRAELRVLGAAPARLLPFVTRVYEGREGLTATMRNGLEIYFGNSDRPRAKWLSAARVLADPSSSGASYVDVRLPERPAAGGAGAALEGATSGASTAVSASDPTAAALAATLNEAVAGGASATSPATASATSPATASASPAPSAENEQSLSTSG